MTLIKILVSCPHCQRDRDDQPNYCRKCGGSGWLRSTITKNQLARMGDVPAVLGAAVVADPKRRKAARV